MAKKIIARHVSNEALAHLKSKSPPIVNELRTQSIIFLHNVSPLFFCDPQYAAATLASWRHDSIDALSIFGGKNSNYAGEMLESLQGLNRECTPELSDFIRENCWVINNTGIPTSFMAANEAQEMNIKDIKGRKNCSRHTIPKKELDVQEMQKYYSTCDVHVLKPGRVIKRGANRTSLDVPKNVMAKGFTAAQLGQTLPNCIETRTIERSTTEDWDVSVPNSDEEEENSLNKFVMLSIYRMTVRHGERRKIGEACGLDWGVGGKAEESGV
ncbi:hypothetical protein B0H19DRAFT_1083399 [Mycena capillaripes]|nr:hypothetical protein B0H19DRAFT_1083399 [Mycena capillaripes]